jgi:hypothetical protein
MSMNNRLHAARIALGVTNQIRIDAETKKRRLVSRMGLFMSQREADAFDKLDEEHRKWIISEIERRAR